MLAIGLVWVLLQGWQLTFIGFIIAPVFVSVMGLQMRLVAWCEMRNEKVRDTFHLASYPGMPGLMDMLEA